MLQPRLKLQYDYICTVGRLASYRYRQTQIYIEGIFLMREAQMKVQSIPSQRWYHRHDLKRMCTHFIDWHILADKQCAECYRAQYVSERIQKTQSKQKNNIQIGRARASQLCVIVLFMRVVLRSRYERPSICLSQIALTLPRLVVHFFPLQTMLFIRSVSAVTLSP